MNILSDLIIACGLICMFGFSIIGIVSVIDGQNKQCEVTFQHNDKVIVHIGQWK
jgi:hypothetical protein